MVTMPCDRAQQQAKQDVNDLFIPNKTMIPERVYTVSPKHVMSDVNESSPYIRPSLTCIILSSIHEWV